MRQWFFALLLSSTLVSGFALTPVKLALDWYINPDHAPILAAETQGYFKQNGLDVTLLEPTQASTTRALVASGQAAFGIDYGNEAPEAIRQGLPLVIIGSLVPEPLSCMAVLQSSGITSLAQLKGKKIGYSGDAIEASTINKELVHTGLQPDQVTLVPIQMDLSQALLSHTVDAVNGMMRNVEPVMLQMRGIHTTLFYPEQNGIPPYSELVFIAKTDTDPKLEAAFLKAVTEGRAYVKAHPQEAWEQALQAYPQQLGTSKQIRQENAAIRIATVPYF